MSNIELLGCVEPTSTQRTKWAQANHSLASTLAPAGSKNRSACTRARRRWYRAMCASARGSASSTGASMTGRCRTVRVEELCFEVIGRRVVGSVWLSDGWYCIVFGESHLYINKPSAKKEGKLSVPLRSHFPFFSLVSERVVSRFGQSSSGPAPASSKVVRSGSKGTS